MLMDNPRQCAQCGTVLSDYALEGVCGNCLLKPGLEPVPQPLDEPGEETYSPALRADSDRSRHIDAVGRLGDYELLEEIARGGMGIVYGAAGEPGPHRRGEDALARRPVREQGVRRNGFAPKRRRRPALQHPNIVAIHEVGAHEGQHFFAMDYVEGPNLAKLSAATVRCQPGSAARYVKTIAEAIHYAHERGILHRDLKPSNVLIDRDRPAARDRLRPGQAARSRTAN